MCDSSKTALMRHEQARGVPGDDDSHRPIEELVAVMVVVRNRRVQFARWPAGGATCKRSAWRPSSSPVGRWPPGANHDELLAPVRQTAPDRTVTRAGPPITGAIDPFLAECLYLADGVIAGTLIDRAGSATSYYSPRVMLPTGGVPAWAIGRPSRRIGDQCFLSL
jgi:hypothetical protein